jgi:Cys-tRNA(Pro) deacylase
MTVFTTKITRLLDEHGIEYRVLHHNLPALTVASAAEQRGVAPTEMVKCILLVDKNHRYVMACVTGDARLSPNAVRAQLPDDWMRLSFASAREILGVTGHVQGAISPLGLPDDVPVILDLEIAQRNKVIVSSGDPMAGLEIDTANLIQAAGGRLARIAQSGSAK